MADSRTIDLWLVKRAMDVARLLKVESFRQEMSAQIIKLRGYHDVRGNSAEGWIVPGNVSQNTSRISQKIQHEGNQSTLEGLI